MECMASRCSSVAIEGELFCHEHIHMTGEVDPMECPRGCGPMLYKQDSWNNGALWILGSLIPMFWVEQMPLLAVASCVLILAYGHSLHKKNADYRFSCKKCEGVLLDNKTLSSVKNNYVSDISEKLISELDNSIESSEVKCPGCEVNMARIPISYVLPDTGTGILVIDLIKAVVPNTMNLLELDGCRDCGLIWFDKGEIAKIGNSQTLRGEHFGESGKGWYSESRKSKRAFEGMDIKRDDGRILTTHPGHFTTIRKASPNRHSKKNFTYCSVDGCNALAFRNLEYCHRHK